MERSPLRRTGTLLTAAALLASLTVATFAAPAAAANPKLAIVHGIPGVRADICIDGKEVKSRMAYGTRGTLPQHLMVGGRKIKVYRTDPRKCRGRLMTSGSGSAWLLTQTSRWWPPPGPRRSWSSTTCPAAPTRGRQRHLPPQCRQRRPGAAMGLKSTRTRSPLAPAAPTPFFKGDELFLEPPRTSCSASKLRRPTASSSPGQVGWRRRSSQRQRTRMATPVTSSSWWARS